MRVSGMECIDLACGCCELGTDREALRGARIRACVTNSRADLAEVSRLRPGVRRAGLSRQSAALMPGQRRAQRAALIQYGTTRQCLVYTSKPNRRPSPYHLGAKRSVAVAAAPSAAATSCSSSAEQTSEPLDAN